MAAGGVVGVLNDFEYQPESLALYPDHTPAGIIGEAYQNLFGRAVEPDGLAYWAAVVAGGQTLGAVIDAIMMGALGTDADSVVAKTEAAGVVTNNYAYTTADIPAARAWLAGITSPSQVQPAVENPPF